MALSLPLIGGVRMASIVLELQRDALNRTVPVSDLLRKALVVARKLGLTEMQQWLELELNGYGASEQCPQYREVTGRVMGWNPYRGWIPVGFDDAEEQRRLSARKCGQSIAELESLVNDATKGAGYHMPFPVDQTLRLSSGMSLRTQLSLFTQKAALVGIIDAVRNSVLDWALKLEEGGVLGEGLTFSETERAAAVTATHNVTNFFGPVTGVQVQQAGENAIQISATLPDSQALTAFLDQLRAESPNLGLDDEVQRELGAETDTLASQMKSPKPKPAIVRESLRSIRTILEGAAGGAAGQGLVMALTKLLGG